MSPEQRQDVVHCWFAQVIVRETRMAISGADSGCETKKIEHYDAPVEWHPFHHALRPVAP